jgi:4-diphosphocytidyl-2C-methyl-D-erythritol kinase
MSGDRVPSRSITVRAAAKINLHLGVGAVRADGFHPLATVYQAIGLYDDVTVTDAQAWEVHTIADDGIDLEAVPDDANNIAIRAGQALAAHHGVTKAAHVEIHKGIPVAGGMAGGSADAAAALVALDRLWGVETPDDDLLAIAATLGSDVPFALLGGTAIGTGRGELVEPLTCAVDLWWLVVPSEIGLPTPLVYRAYDDLAAKPDAPAPAGERHPAELVAALVDGDAPAVIAALHNDLTPPAYALRPDLAARAGELTELLGDQTCVLLSGSGPTQLIPFAGVDAARDAAAALSAAGIAHWLAPGPVAGTHVVSYA